jgi:2'-5' RNA ligase
MVRCFVGIRIPSSIRKEILPLQRDLKILPMSCKLVEPENLHLTISFLGERSPSEIKKIAEKLNIIIKDFQKFEVEIEKLKTIPSERFLRVIALEVKSETLTRLTESVRSKIGGKVVPSHLTLCRVKKVRDRISLLEGLKKLKIPKLSFRVNKIELIKSTLTRKGPIYETLYEVKLA